MENFDIEYTPDGCPNNCAYCRENNYKCVYGSDNGGSEEREDMDNFKEECCKCHKKIFSNEAYEYKGFTFCEDCFDSGKLLVEEKIKKSYTGMNFYDKQLQEEIRNGKLN